MFAFPAAIALAVITTSMAEYHSEPELMAITIGYPSEGAYPYALKDDLENCLNKKNLELLNTTIENSFEIIICTTQLFSSKTLSRVNMIRKHKIQNRTDGELLDNYCSNWVPTINKCFMPTTSLINFCYPNETTRGYSSLFFTAAYMNFICANKNTTLENVIRKSDTELSLKCFSEIEMNILDCVQTNTKNNQPQEFCSKFAAVKLCVEQQYSAAQECDVNSKNFTFSLLKSIESELCHSDTVVNEKTKQMKEELMLSQQAAQKDTSHERDSLTNDKQKSNKGNRASCAILILATMTALASTLIIFS